jgi:hypothetical protein
MSTLDLHASETRTSYDVSPSPTRRQRIRWAGTPVALVAGTASTVHGFVLHPREMEVREFVTWIGHYPAQFAIAHLLIGIGCTVAAAGSGRPSAWPAASAAPCSSPASSRPSSA